MVKVVILGSGNVGYHLSKIFLSSNNVDLIQVYSRNIHTIEFLKDKVSITDNINSLLNADIYIIAISDGSIVEFSKSLPHLNKLVVHTSGSISIDAINSENKGVLYPLQTFSKNKEIDFKNIPLCIETSNEKSLVLLQELASAISDQVFLINSEQRAKIHLAAVFVNNFVNHLYEIGQQICKANEIPFEILHPLIKETSEKIMTCSPKNAQTGPAKRNDQETIKKQLKQLNMDDAKVYETLTQSILKIYS